MGKIVQPFAQLIKTADGDGLNAVAQHRFQGFFPAFRHLQLVGETRFVIQFMPGQPVADRAIVAHGRFLQGFQGGATALQALQLLAGLIQLTAPVAVIPAKLVDLFLQGLAAQFVFFRLPAILLHLLFQLAHFLGQRAGIQGFLLFLQTVDTVAQPLLGLVQMLNAGLLHLGLAARFPGFAVEFFPRLLPVLHGLFGQCQRFAGRFLLLGDHFQFRLALGQNGIQFRHFLAVDAQVLVAFFPAGAYLVQLLVQLLLALALMLDALLQACHFRPQGVKMLLDFVKALLHFVVLLAQAFHFRVHVALFCHFRFHGHVQFANHMVQLLDLHIQPFPAQRLELRAFQAFFLFVLLVFLRRAGLPAQALDLTLQLFANIRQALQILTGATNTVLGLAAAGLVLGDPRRFLDIHPQLFRLGFNQPGNHALLNNGVAARAQTGAQEDVGNVLAAALGAVEEIVGLAVAGDLTLYRDLVELAVFASDSGIGVIEDQLNGRLGHRLAGIGAIEDHVRHGLTAQVLGGGFPHHPAYRVNDIGLPTPVGPHHGGEVFREIGGGRVHKGFEPGQFY